VLALCVVEPLDVVEHVGAAFISGSLNASVQPFGFQRGEEALHGGIIPAVPALAHAAHDPGVGQQHLELLTGVLAALVGVMQDLARPASPMQRHHQGVGHHLRRHAGLHGPTDDAS